MKFRLWKDVITDHVLDFSRVSLRQIATTIKKNKKLLCSAQFKKKTIHYQSKKLIQTPLAWIAFVAPIFFL